MTCRPSDTRTGLTWLDGSVADMQTEPELTAHPFVQLQVATSLDGQGRVGVVTSDLSQVQVVIQDPAAERPQIGTTTAKHFMDEVMGLLPPVPDEGAAGEHPRGEVVVQQELSVALAHALKVGDAEQVSAICAESGFAGVPPLLRSLSAELRGSAQLVIRSSDRDDLGAMSLLLISTGWVELAPGPGATLRHIPRSEDGVRAAVLSAVTARAASLIRAQGVGSDG